MWLWLTSYAVLFGAEINAEAEQQTIKDSTVGPAKPLGQRGAVAADSRPPTDSDTGDSTGDSDTGDHAATDTPSATGLVMTSNTDGRNVPATPPAAATPATASPTTRSPH